ncbi:MAG: Growth inhibitor [Parcubacteria group bacterium GW2011_GWA2_49_9]|nr:MAG: Growth inhibitor [Parcubacteria group bacterium GW2011_GWA2_49_9]
MEKNFDAWNEDKKKLDRMRSDFDFHEREIWWCAIGINVGSEQLSFSADFSRPILVVRRLSPNVFLGIPFTTKTDDKLPFRVRVVVEGVSNDVLIGQIRAFDRKRLYRKIAVLAEADFDIMKNHLVEMIEG